ncbi:MAG: hypothetical protein OJF60_001639 [Burkholderiaceae bacterium]|jgi:hypothetical protein|nr:MAG: hypothetical protein OJF60_001639 [Burkholderiaceae bacterium]
MARFKVVALKRWKGSLDGKAIDSAKLYIEVKLDDSRNGVDQFAKGVFTEELRLPSSELVKRLERLPLPFMAEVDTERVGNGRESREVVLDVRPVGAPVIDQQTGEIKPGTVRRSA